MIKKLFRALFPTAGHCCAKCAHVLPSHRQRYHAGAGPVIMTATRPNAGEYPAFPADAPICNTCDCLTTSQFHKNHCEVPS